jgi:hypothetical protein
MRFHDPGEWVLIKRSLLCQKLTADFKQMLVAFQQNVIGLQKKE